MYACLKHNGDRRLELDKLNKPLPSFNDRRWSAHLPLSHPDPWAPPCLISGSTSIIAEIDKFVGLLPQFGLFHHGGFKLSLNSIKISEIWGFSIHIVCHFSAWTIVQSVDFIDGVYN